MTEEDDAVLAYRKEYRVQLRQPENQRAILTNYVLVITAGMMEEFRQAHGARYPQLSRLRLNWLWVGLHIGIAVYGIVLVCIAGLVQ